MQCRLNRAQLSAVRNSQLVEYSSLCIKQIYHMNFDLELGLVVGYGFKDVIFGYKFDIVQVYDGFKSTHNNHEIDE